MENCHVHIYDFAAYSRPLGPDGKVAGGRRQINEAERKTERYICGSLFGALQSTHHVRHFVKMSNSKPRVV
jgi:hypothetical protein